MSLRVAVQMDPIESINIDADSTFALMLEAQARGHQLHYCEQGDLYSKGRVYVNAGPLSLADNDEDWYRAHQKQPSELAAFDAVLMRKDPPFDLEYVASTWLLSDQHSRATLPHAAPHRGC